MSRGEAFSLDRAFTRRELVLAALALGVVGALAFIPHIRNGGFYLDDWSNGAGALYPPGGPGFGNALSYFYELTDYRPVLVLYVPLTYMVLGMHVAYHLALAASLAVLVSVLLYGVLRTLGVPWIHALFVSALVLLFPWFDSTRFWATADQISLALAFMLGGLWIALRGLSRHSYRWHAAAACLYLLSILTYEVALPLIAALGAIYVMRAGWRVAKFRWAIDLAVAIGGAIWVGIHTQRTKSGLSGNIHHLGEIIDGGAEILGRTLLPLGSAPTSLALLALAAILIAGLAARLTMADRFAARSGWGLQGWLLLSFGGLAVAVLGWVMFIPADPYYTPVIWGMTNRVNGLAGIGLVMLVYGVFGIVGSLIGQLRPRNALLGLAVTAALGLALGAGYVKVIRRHTPIWDAAYVAEVKALDEIQAVYPHMPSGSTLFTSSYPAYQTLGVPILATTWDVNGMVKTRYGDESLAAYPVISGLSLACRAEGIGVVEVGVPETIVPYGKVRLLNLQTLRHSEPRNRRACRSVIDAFPPGPFYLNATY